MNDYPSAIAPVNHVEPAPRRVRAVLAGETIFDTTGAKYVWEWPYYPQYYIPLEDVRTDLLVAEGNTQATRRGHVELYGLRVHDVDRTRAAKLHTESPTDGLTGTVRFDWDALDAWFEEDEQVFVHPRSPYVRVEFVIASLRLRRLDVARRYAEAGYAFCSERALDTLGTYLLGGLARVEFLAGRWDQATELAAKTVRDPRTAPAPRVWALGVLGLVRARRGDPEASPPLETAHEIVSPTGQIAWIAPIAAARAEAAWLVGDHGAVAGLTTAAFDLACERRELWAIGELAFWRRQAGLHDRLPAGVPEPYASMLVGDSTRAGKRWRAMGFPYEAALARAEDDDPIALREAIQELQRLGARASVAVVARSARARGARGLPRGPRQQTRENPAGLTTRELEVLALIADGLRNAEIAQRLVVSQKTVDHHVSAVLRKLDVRHRGEVGAAAARLGLLQ